MRAAVCSGATSPWRRLGATAAPNSGAPASGPEGRAVQPAAPDHHIPIP
ncbi:hypothetical protein SUDANB174_00129 [Streptomyces sp. enrichment culture]